MFDVEALRWTVRAVVYVGAAALLWHAGHPALAIALIVAGIVLFGASEIWSRLGAPEL